MVRVAGSVGWRVDLVVRGHSVPRIPDGREALCKCHHLLPADRVTLDGLEDDFEVQLGAVGELEGDMGVIAGGFDGEPTRRIPPLIITELLDANARCVPVHVRRSAATGPTSGTVVPEYPDGAISGGHVSFFY